MLPDDQLLNDPEIRALAIKRLEQENELGALQITEKVRIEKAMAATAAQRGEFVFAGIITESTVHDFMSSLENWRHRAGNQERDITILLNSPGGSVLDGLALIDYIFLLRKEGHFVKIIGTGLVASMAGALLEAASERCLTSRAYFGMHEVSSYAGGTTTQHEDHQKFTKKLQEEIVQLLTARSNLTPAKLRTIWKRKDIYCDAKQALAYGLIDKIEDTLDA